MTTGTYYRNVTYISIDLFLLFTNFTMVKIIATSHNLIKNGANNTISVTFFSIFPACDVTDCNRVGNILSNMFSDSIVIAHFFDKFETK